MGKKLLVTGGAGYIGSHFCALAEDLGCDFVVLDNLSRGRSNFVDSGRLIVGSIEDRELVSDICREHEIDVVVHFAGFAYVGESMLDPELYYENNLAATVHFLSALRASGVTQVVFSSTCATYGVPSINKPITEGTPQCPVNPYGRSKLFIEHVLADYAMAYGFGVMSLRYFNAAGTSKAHALFEHHDPESHLIPLAIDAASGGPELVVYGGKHLTQDGTCVRDYVHVDDLADAHIRAVKRLRSGGASASVNLGSGRGASVLDVIRATERALSTTLPYRIGEARPGDPPVLIAAIEQAWDELGWRPRHTDLDGIIRSAKVGHDRWRSDMCLNASIPRTNVTDDYHLILPREA